MWTEDPSRYMYAAHQYVSPASSQDTHYSSYSSERSRLGCMDTFVASVPRERAYEISALRASDDYNEEHGASWNDPMTNETSQGYIHPGVTNTYHMSSASPFTEDTDSMPPTSPENRNLLLSADESLPHNFGSRPKNLNRPIATEAIRRASGKRRKYPVVCKCPHDKCGQDFTTTYSRDRHLSSHRKDKPFECRRKGCTQAFTHASDRKRHEKSVRKHPSRLD